MYVIFFLYSISGNKNNWIGVCVCESVCMCVCKVQILQLLFKVGANISLFGASVWCQSTCKIFYPTQSFTFLKTFFDFQTKIKKTNRKLACFKAKISASRLIVSFQEYFRAADRAPSIYLYWKIKIRAQVQFRKWKKSIRRVDSGTGEGGRTFRSMLAL